MFAERYEPECRQAGGYDSYTMYIRALSASVARNWHLADDHVTSSTSSISTRYHDNILSRFLMVWRLAAVFEIERKSDSSLSVGRLSVVAVYLSQEMVWKQVVIK